MHCIVIEYKTLNEEIAVNLYFSSTLTSVGFEPHGRLFLHVSNSLFKRQI